jgi:hypothetical protein
MRHTLRSAPPPPRFRKQSRTLGDRILLRSIIKAHKRALARLSETRQAEDDLEAARLLHLEQIAKLRRALRRGLREARATAA